MFWGPGDGAVSQRLHGRTARGFSQARRRRLLGLSLLVLLAGGCWRGAPEDGDLFTAVLAASRPGEARLVGSPWREPASRSEAFAAILRNADRAFGQALREKITAETLRQNAVVKLLAGEADSAIASLSEAAELEPTNAMVWSDLAAAHLQRSAAASDPYEVLLALAAANRAVRHDPALQEGRFNRALAFELLSLHAEAREEWELVSRKEPDPLWAREAREHAVALARKAAPRDWTRDLSAVQEAIEQGKPEKVRSIVEGSPQSFREHLEEKLIPTWAKAEAEHRVPDAVRALTDAQAIADALVALGGDPMAAETISQIARARLLDPARFQRLAAGFLAYSEGLDLISDSLARALLRFETAWAALARERSPFAYWAAYRIAYCQYQSAAYPEARARLLALTRDPAATPYKALQGRSLVLTGLIDGIEGYLTASLVSFEGAETAFRAVKEVSSAARVNALLANDFYILGQPKEAWHRLYSALIEPATFERPDIRFFVCLHASWLAQREGETEIALWFQDEVVRNARILGRPEAVVGALRQRASLLAALGRKAEAARDLARAREALEEVSDPSIRQIVEGDLLLVESELAGTAAPEQAIERLDKAIQIFRDTSYHYRLAEALYQRARANIALGRNDAAELDLAAAIAELEQQRETVGSAEDRISYFDRVKNIFDTMIAFQLEQRRRPDEALRFSEQAKARVLWDWMVTRPTGEPALPDLRSAASRSFNFSPLQRELPEGTAVIEYAVLPRKIVLWVFHRDGTLQSETVETGAEALDDLVRRLRRALLDHRSAEFEPLAEQAYDLLIRPAERHLAPGERLVLIPDGALHALPFSLLRDRQTGRHLIQDRALAVAPSIRVLVESRRRDRVLARSSGSVLVVTAPEFDREIDPTLLPLKAGDAEASIARIFPGSQVLRDRGATRDAFLRNAGRFEIVHFGGHSVVNVDFPLLSRMLFASHPADPSRGVLYSGDVLRQRFPRTRLVVLASCGTALGRISRTEGVENLARPFLAAGVPSVVAALWDVDDQITADFFVRFYRNLKHGVDVAEALRATQIESLKQGSGPAAHPRAWGAFEVIGGGAAERETRSALR